MVWGRAVLGAAVIALMPLAPAVADGTVTVHGTSFPEGRAAQLSFVGCADPYARTAEQPVPYVGIGPGQAPVGSRSLGYDLAGGNAAGSVHYVDSMLATTVAGLSVNAPEGASGVSYAGYQEPRDWGTGRVWFGRVELSAPAGGWSQVDVAGLQFTWTKYDMIGQRRLGQTAPAARISTFVKAHGGDGHGFFTIGFGCDGRPFNIDALRIGRPGAVTTYDLEGLATSTSISGPNGAVDAGQQVTLRGAVVDQAGAPVPGARLVLEAQGAGGGWNLVEGVDAANPVVTVAPEQTTTYRYRFVDRPLAEGSVSAPFTVEVRTAPEAKDKGKDKAQAKPDKQPAKPEQRQTKPDRQQPKPDKTKPDKTKPKPDKHDQAEPQPEQTPQQQPESSPTATVKPDDTD